MSRLVSPLFLKSSEFGRLLVLVSLCLMMIPSKATALMSSDSLALVFGGELVMLAVALHMLVAT